MVEENLCVMQSLEECVRETRAALGEQLLTGRQRRDLRCGEVAVLEEAQAQLSETRVVLRDELVKFAPDAVTPSDSGHGGLVSDTGGVSPAGHKKGTVIPPAWSDEPGGSCEWGEGGSRDLSPAGAGSPPHPRNSGTWGAGSAAGAPSGGLGGLMGLCGAVAVVFLRCRGRVPPDAAGKVLESILGALAGQSKRAAEAWGRFRPRAFTAQRCTLREGVHYPRTGSREYVVD